MGIGKSKPKTITFTPENKNQVLKLDLNKKSNVLINKYTPDPNKWRPSDDIYYRHEFYTMQVANAHRDKKKIKTLEEKKESILQDIERLEKREDKDEIFMQQTIRLLKEDLPKIELEIKKCKNTYERILTTDASVVKEWEEYNNKIYGLIQDNNLEDYVKPENLYTSSNFYLFLSNIIRSLQNSFVNETDVLDRMNKLSQVIDIGYVQHQKVNSMLTYFKKVQTIEDFNNFERELCKIMDKSLAINDQQNGVVAANGVGVPYASIEDKQSIPIIGHIPIEAVIPTDKQISTKPYQVLSL